MLDLTEQAAVKAVLRDLTRGIRVPRGHWSTLLGPEAEIVENISAAYPDLRGVSLEDADSIIHNALNLYVHGLSISSMEWEAIGVQSQDVERAFASWQREV